jgi:hypothetical protein
MSFSINNLINSSENNLEEVDRTKPLNADTSTELSNSTYKYSIIVGGQDISKVSSSIGNSQNDTLSIRAPYNTKLTVTILLNKDKEFSLQANVNDTSNYTMSNKNSSGGTDIINSVSHSATYTVKIGKSTSDENSFDYVLMSIWYDGSPYKSIQLKINPYMTTPTYSGTVTGVGTTGLAANTATPSASTKPRDPYDSTKQLEGTWKIKESDLINYSASSISDVPENYSYTAIFTPTNTNYNTIEVTGVKITSSIPAATESISMVSHTDKSITVKANSTRANSALKIEYSIDGTNYYSSGTFDNLNSNSNYSFYFRYSTSDGRSKGTRSSAYSFKTLAKESFVSAPKVDYSTNKIINLVSGSSYLLSCPSLNKSETFENITTTTIPYLEEYIPYDITITKLSKDTTVSVDSDPYTITKVAQSTFASNTLALNDTWENVSGKYYMGFKKTPSSLTEYRLSTDTEWTNLNNTTKVECGLTYEFRYKGTSVTPSSTKYTLKIPKPLSFNDNDADSGRTTAYPNYEHNSLSDLSKESKYKITSVNASTSETNTFTFLTGDYTYIPLQGTNNDTDYSFYNCTLTITRLPMGSSVNYTYSESQSLKIANNIAAPLTTNFIFSPSTISQRRISIQPLKDIEYYDEDLNRYFTLYPSNIFEPKSTIKVRIKGTLTTPCSLPLTLTLPDIYATPSFNFNYATEKIEGLEPKANYKIKVMNTTYDFTANASGMIDLTLSETCYANLKTYDGEFYRSSSTTDYVSSSSISISLKAVGEAPVVKLVQQLGTANFSIVGESSSLLEVAIGDSSTYESITEDQLFSLNNTSIKVRYKATKNNYASNYVTLTVPTIEIAPDVSLNEKDYLITGFTSGQTVFVEEELVTANNDGSLYLEEPWMGNTIKIQTINGDYTSMTKELSIPTKDYFFNKLKTKLTTHFDSVLTKYGLTKDKVKAYEDYLDNFDEYSLTTVYMLSVIEDTFESAFTDYVALLLETNNALSNVSLSTSGQSALDQLLTWAQDNLIKTSTTEGRTEVKNYVEQQIKLLSVDKIASTGSISGEIYFENMKASDTITIEESEDNNQSLLNEKNISGNALYSFSITSSASSQNGYSVSINTGNKIVDGTHKVMDSNGNISTCETSNGITKFQTQSLGKFVVYDENPSNSVPGYMIAIVTIESVLIVGAAGFFVARYLIAKKKLTK